MNVKVVNKSRHPLPQYQTAGAAAMDAHANIAETVTLQPGERSLITTGLHFELPIGYEMQIRPRSGLAAKHGISIVNTPGTLDSDYRGELMVILINLGQEPFEINDGDRIAQLIVAPIEQVQWEEVEELSDSERGTSGYGSTGVAKDAM